MRQWCRVGSHGFCYFYFYFLLLILLHLSRPCQGLLCYLSHPLGLLLSYDTTIPAQGARGLQSRWPSLRRGQPRPSPFFAFPMGPALTVALQTLAP